MRTGKTLAIAGTLASLIIAGCTTTEQTLQQGYVTDFESCMADDGSVQEGTPSRCLFGGQYFVEGR